MSRPRLVRVYKNVNAGGGVQSRLVELLPRLAEHFDVRLLCYRARGSRAGELEDAGISVDLIPIGLKWAPWNVNRYVEYFRRRRPHIVHTHEYTANTLGTVAADRAGVPIRVRHIHTMVPWGWKGRFRTTLRVLGDTRAARRAQVTLAVSEAARSHYLAGSSLSPASCRVLYNGIDLRRFANCVEEGRGFRTEWDLPEHVPVVGIVGRLSRGKGHADFLRAARVIAARLPNVRFLVVGDGGLRPGLESLARDLELGDRVIFTGFRSDIPAALGAMNLFLVTSRPEREDRIQEGFGVAAIEAQAAGLPVVAFRLPVTDEVVEDGVTGTIVPQGDAEAMAEAAVGYLCDPTKAELTSGRAKRKAQAFSLDACVRNTLNLYEEMLRGSGETGAETENDEPNSRNHSPLHS